MSSSSLRSFPPLLAALVAGLVAIVCAFFGLAPTEPDVVSRWFHAAAVLTFDLPEDAAGPLIAAAQIATLVFGATAVWGLVEELSPRSREGLWRLWFFLIRRTRPAVVVVGLGEVGATLATELRTVAKRPVYAVDLDPTSPAAAQLRRKGGIVLGGDATLSEVRSRLPLDRADEIILATGDDVRNLEIAGALLAETTDAHKKRVVYVHVGNATTHDVAVEQGLLPPTMFETQFRLFGVLIEGAVDLMERLLDRDHAPKQDEVAHYVLLGFGEVGQAVAQAMARFAHVPNGRRLRLSIFYDPSESKEVERFLALYPAFCPAPNALRLRKLAKAPGEADRWDMVDKTLRPHKSRRTREREHPRAIEYAVNAEFVERAAPVSPETVADLRRWFGAETPDVRPAIVVAFDDEARNARVAAGLRDRLAADLAWPPDPDAAFTPPARPTDGLPDVIPIFVYQFREDGLKPLLGRTPPAAAVESRSSWIRRHLSARYPLRLFGLAADTASYEAMTQPDRRIRAEHLRNAYEALSDNRRVLIPPAFERSNLDAELLNRLTIRREFEALPPGQDAEDTLMRPDDEGLSSVQQFARELAPHDPTLPERLAEMEHNRWMAERFTSDWRRGERSEAGRRRLQFLAWSDDDLTDKDREYDRQQIPELLIAERERGQCYRLPRPASPGDSE